MLRRSGQQTSTRNKTRKNSRTGATLVEFALVGNLFFFFLFTCMEFTRIGMVRNLAQDAAYFAAREAMVPGATKNEAEQAAHRMMGMLLSSGYDVDVDDIDDNSDEVSVTVSVNFNEVAFFVPMFMPNPRISTTAVVRSERYGGFFRL